VGATCLGSGTLDRDAWKVGAGYKFGDLSVGAIYESIDGDVTTAVAHDSWGLNAAYTMGAITLKASYAQAGEVDSAAGAEIANSGADMWAVGVDYSLSKRTVVQLTYAKMDNDSVGGWDLGQGQQVTNAASGSDVSGFSLGVKHTF
jgi:predicted porin